MNSGKARQIDLSSTMGEKMHVANGYSQAVDACPLNKYGRFSGVSERSRIEVSMP